ncbi:MAG: GGDEF domain-containing protein [Caldicoprobacterales bacterium]
MIRIVDPVRKKVLDIEGNQSFEADIPCYSLWKKRQLCENCISIRAFNENDTIYRLEHKDDRIYMITAIPVDVDGKRVVVEILKEVTSNLVLGSGEGIPGLKIFSMVEEMNRIAITDSLTGLYNRRYINQRLPIDLLNTSQREEPLSIILADLDFFKDVNDTYGHVAGDEVLKEIAGVLKENIRKKRDWVARYGGEEFLICLTNTDLESAKKTAERIRYNIEKKHFFIEGNEFNLTSSLGVYMICGATDDMTFDQVIELVDKQLYKAKKSGRNIVK